MYCLGAILPCKEPCGFVEPVFFSEFENTTNGFTCERAADGTISRFIPYSQSYSIEYHNTSPVLEMMKYEIGEPVPLAFIFFKNNKPHLIIGNHQNVCKYLSMIINFDDVFSVPAEALFKAAQFLNEEYLDRNKKRSIYYNYFLQLKKKNVDYAYMWKRSIREIESIRVSKPIPEKVWRLIPHKKTITIDFHHLSLSCQTKPRIRFNQNARNLKFRTAVPMYYAKAKMPLPVIDISHPMSYHPIKQFASRSNMPNWNGISVDLIAPKGGILFHHRKKTSIYARLTRCHFDQAYIATEKTHPVSLSCSASKISFENEEKKTGTIIFVP